MEQGNRSSNNNAGEKLLHILRGVEAAQNANATEAITTTERPQSEDHVHAEHLVSSITVNITPNMIELENVGLPEFREGWRGERIDRTRIRVNRADEIAQNEESDEDYLLENVIVFRFIDDFRPQRDGIVKTQIIWNSKFSWRDIKQHLENDTYTFYFKYENVFIDSSDNSDEEETEDEEIITDNSDEEETEEEIISSDAEEVWVNSSVRAAIDALPAVVSPQDKESGDVVMCSICRETFSTRDPAKQLPCTHSFHANCILLWFDRKHSCPVCRRKVVLQQDNLVVLNLSSG